MKKVALLLLIFLVTSSAFVLLSQNAPISRVENYIAVLDIRCGSGVEQNISVPLTNIIIDELVRTKKWTVIDRAHRDSILTEQGFQQTGCVDESCTVEAGRLLGVGKMIVGSLARLGQTYIFTLQLINVETAVVENSARETCKNCTEDDLIAVVVLATSKLLGETVTQPVEMGTAPSQHKCPSWPDQATRILSDDELAACSCRELDLLRNEIYARHGRKFVRKDLKEYFESKRWYKIDPQNPQGDKYLNNYEQKNINIIVEFEKRIGCRTSTKVSSECPSWPAQATIYLTESDLEPCDCAQLRILRNEIYARHGRIFKSADLQRYFGSQPWYRPDLYNPEGTSGWNAFERRNVTTIVNFEKQVGCK